MEASSYNYLSLNDPRFAGVWEPSWAPAICGEPISVKHLIVNGNWSIRNNEIPGLDEEQLLAEARGHLEKLKSKY